MDNSFQLVILQSGITLLLTRPINKTNKNLIVAGNTKVKRSKRVYLPGLRCLLYVRVNN